MMCLFAAPAPQHRKKQTFQLSVIDVTDIQSSGILFSMLEELLWGKSLIDLFFFISANY
jgi:hypothetical protein